LFLLFYFVSFFPPPQDRGSLCSPAVWNSICRSSKPQTQRSIRLCLPKGVCFLFLTACLFVLKFRSLLPLWAVSLIFFPHRSLYSTSYSLKPALIAGSLFLPAFPEEGLT
jgi:hypothetical protein